LPSPPQDDQRLDRRRQHHLSQRHQSRHRGGARERLDRPVVKAAGEKNTLGLSKAIQDIAERARSKKLNPEKCRAARSRLPTPGNFGAQFGLPIINQPQVADSRRRRHREATGGESTMRSGSG
jgi:hypothetical protein